MNAIQAVVFALLGLWAIGMTVVALKLRNRAAPQNTKSKPLYRYIFDLLDYAEALTKRISPDEPDSSDYFITLVYVEDILNKYGRGLARQSAREAYGSDEKASEIKRLAEKRMDELGRQIRIFAQKYDFDETLKSSGEEIYNNWHKLPADHPNIQSTPDFQV